jgi:hypothetical protein
MDAMVGSLASGNWISEVSGFGEFFVYAATDQFVFNRPLSV